MKADSRPYVGFVLEQSLGHITHSDNLARLLPHQHVVDPELFLVPWDTTGLQAKLPVFRSNWTVRAGVRARRGIREMHRRRRLDALFVHTQVAAVLSPTPGTPGSPSDGSPRKAAKSA